MDFCSIEEAFPNHNKEALRQERKKAKRCKGPAQAFIDPDRLNTSVKKPIPPAMNPLTGLREHEPVDEEYEGFSGGGGGVGGGDTNERLAKDTSPAAKNYGKMPNIEQVDKQLAKNNAMPSFFGKDPAEGYTNFSHSVSDSQEYTLQPGPHAGFSSNFDESGTLGAAGATTDILPIPSVRDVWKPLTPSGARTAFFNGLPYPGGSTTQAPNSTPLTYDKTLHSKIDKIFARLDQIESGRTTDTSNAQTEVLLFIMSGIFVLFLTDLAVRKGGR